MYCQQCGSEIGEGNFCRKCGAPSGSAALSEPRQATIDPPDYEKGFKKFFMGMAFLIIAIFPIFTGSGFWWWMLFPAVPLLAAGLGEFMRSRHVSAIRPAPSATLSAGPVQARAASQGELLRARNTAELIPPPGVTEDPTRHLDKEKIPRD